MKLWNIYKATIQRNCLGSYNQQDGLLYWQNRLFATIIVYWIPISFCALVPGVIMSFVGGIPSLAVVDIVAVFSVMAIAFSTKLNIFLRKILFIGILYLLAITLIYYLGTNGPGLLYLLGITIFIVLIFPANFGYLSVAINIFICILLQIAIRYELLYSVINPFSSFGSWIAISANLVILSLIFSILLPKLFTGLQRTIDKQQNLERELKIQQQFLERSEKRFRILVENAGDVIVTFDEKGNFIYISPAFERITGYTSEELINQSLAVIMNKEQEKKAGQALKETLLKPNVSISTIISLNHKNGNMIWMEGIVTNLLNDENIKGILCNYHDITEKKDAEEKNRANEIRYQALFEQAPDAITITNRDGNYIEVNKSMCHLLGYSKEEYTHLKIADSLFEEDLGITPPRVQNLKQDEEVRYERRLKRKNGTEVYVEVSASTMDDGRHLVFLRDITEKKISEHQKEFDRKNFDALINTTDDLMWSINKNMELITCNKAFEQIVNQLTGRSLSEEASVLQSLFPKNQLSRYQAYFERAFAGEIFTEIDHLTSPYEIWSEISFYPIIQGNEIIGCACYSRNITALKLAEQERIKMTNDLKQRNKNLEQFAYIVSHNLRAPVANISGIIYVMQTIKLDRKEKKVMINELSNSVEKLDNVINDLNHILQVREGEVYHKKELVYFSELVDNIKLSIENMIVKEQFDIISDFSEVNEFMTTKGYLYSIFYNLILNSIKYRRTDIKSFIKIKSVSTNNSISLIFEDNGLGIDLKKKGDQVFGLYKRFHYHTEGKGMGLYMVKTQVETLGGRISIESEVNQGTTFTIEFENNLIDKVLQNNLLLNL